MLMRRRMLARLERQGRCTVTDHGAFVLVNAYSVAASAAFTNTRGRQAFAAKMLVCKVSVVVIGKRYAV